MLSASSRFIFHGAGLFAIYQLLFLHGGHHLFLHSFKGSNKTDVALQTLEYFNSISSLLAFVREVTPSAILIIAISYVWTLYHKVSN